MPEKSNSPVSGLFATGHKLPYGKPELRIVLPTDRGAELAELVAHWHTAQARAECRRGYRDGYFRPECYSPTDSYHSTYTSAYDAGCSAREFDERFARRAS